MTKKFPRFVQSWNKQDGAYIFDRQIPIKYNSIWVCMDVMNDLAEENEDLRARLYAEKTNTVEVINDYAKQFKRHSAQFSFMIDLAEDLGIDINQLEALDD